MVKITHAKLCCPYCHGRVKKICLIGKDWWGYCRNPSCDDSLAMGHIFLRHRNKGVFVWQSQTVAVLPPRLNLALTNLVRQGIAPEHIKELLGPLPPYNFTRQQRLSGHDHRLASRVA